MIIRRSSGALSAAALSMLAATLLPCSPGVATPAAAQTAPAEPSPVIRAGALTIEQPWLRATPGGAKVAGGYVRITNAGTEPDRLIGATIPLTARGEIHEMSMQGGVMKMAPVEGGLEIRPGESVELKPGGYHLMFIDLTSGLKAGESVHGSLVFAKAGTVALTFQVAGIGAQSAPSAAHHH